MVIYVPVRLELYVTFLVIDEAADIVEYHLFPFFKLPAKAGNKFLNNITGIHIVEFCMIGDPANQESIVVVQVPVERDLLYRGIESGCAFVNTGRGIVPDKSSEAGNDNTVVAEEQFAYESSNIHQ